MLKRGSFVLKEVLKEIFSLDYTKFQLKALVNNVLIGTVTVNIFSPIIVVSVLWNHYDNQKLIIWYICSFFLGIIRIFVGARLKRYLQKDNEQKIDFYFKIYLAIIAISGLLWGILIYFGISLADDTYMLFMVTALFSLIAGSTITIGSVFLAPLLFVVFITLPVLFVLKIHSFNLLHIMEAMLIISFIILMLKTSYKNKKLAQENQIYIDLLGQYQNITNSSSIVSKTDLKGIITYANENFCKISGYTQDELIGKNHNIVRHPDTPKLVFKDMWDTIKRNKKTWSGLVKNKAKNGDSYYVSATVSPIFDIYGNIKEYMALRHDITSIMSDKKQLYDYLSVNKLSVLVMIQIEEHATLETFYDRCTLAKIEFNFGESILSLFPNHCNFNKVYYLENGLYACVKSRRECQKSEEYLEKIIKTFISNVEKYKIRLGEIEYDISVICSFSYGALNLYEDVKLGIEKAIENKKRIVYADGLYGYEYENALKNIETLKILKIALDDKKIVSFFQPIIDNKTLKVSKYESLVRLVDKNSKILAPHEFLDVAKKGRYYLQITKIVLENSFAILNNIKEGVSINLSVLDIESSEIKIIIKKLLEEYKDSAHRVTFELLESEDVKYFDDIIKFIEEVKEFGALIAIDDFGTGYSNFERLLKYKPDLLKIDGSLIKNIKDNKLSQNIVETIVLFAKKQNIKTVAEFVESKEIYYIVKEMGIDYSQGYAFGKPEELV